MTEAKKKNVGLGILITYRGLLLVGIIYLVFDRIEQKQFREDDYRFRGKVDYALVIDSIKHNQNQVEHSNFNTQIVNLNTDVGVVKSDISGIKGRLKME